MFVVKEKFNSYVTKNIKHLSDFDPVLYRKLLKERHGYRKSHNHDVLHPHHIEDTIWAHIVLCLQHYHLTEMQFDSEYDALFKILTILCHDIGKVKAKKFREDKQKNVFYAHDVLSVQKTIDFMEYLINTGFYEDTLIEVYIHEVLQAISWHMKIRDIDLSNIKKIDINNNFLGTMVRNDVRFYDTSVIEEKDLCFEDQTEKKYYTFYDKIIALNKTDVIFICGSPGVGKDTFSETHFPDRKILSLDNIRIKKYSDRFNTIGKTPAEIYQAAFDYTDGLNLYPQLAKDIIESYKNGEKVNICVTLMGSKSRKKVLRMIKDIEKDISVSAVMLVASEQTIMSRAKKRKSKYIGLQVIKDMLFRIDIPSEIEGFDFTTTILNQDM